MTGNSAIMHRSPLQTFDKQLQLSFLETGCSSMGMHEKTIAPGASEVGSLMRVWSMGSLKVAREFNGVASGG